VRDWPDRESLVGEDFIEEMDLDHDAETAVWVIGAG
jgi:hypothetical protein